MNIELIYTLHKQEALNYINAFIISLMAGRLFWHKYKLRRDSIIGTTLIILCIWKIYELILVPTAAAGVSSIVSNLFLCSLIYAAKGNIVNVFRKVKDDTR
ncbi:MAG: hypothetical protein PV362_11180 [Providencia heimbachae]|nr:hypothetical protein [Providencia heimbachae]